MKILAIETSCDEIAAAIVDENFQIQENVVFSSAEKAKETGGVVPEIAARDAAEKIVTVLKKTTTNIDISQDIDAIAVTNGPGLSGSLLVGIEAAKTLAFLYQKPLIPVYHIFGHMMANTLWEKDTQKPDIQFPALTLTVSGGHNDLYIWKNFLEYEKLGGTIDDAAGECFDKCARMLSLPYPGGPHLSKKAENADQKKYKLPMPMLKSDNYNFSFSGLKTALFYLIRDLGGIENIPQKEIPHLAASTEYTICQTLLKKLIKAFNNNPGIKQIHITGGVSANRYLREIFKEFAEQNNISFLYPQKITYCTDNASMIAAAGIKIFKENKRKNTLLDIKSVEINLKKF